jgi:hypothetical protein
MVIIIIIIIIMRIHVHCFTFNANYTLFKGILIILLVVLCFLSCTHIVQ